MASWVIDSWLEGIRQVYLLMTFRKLSLAFLSSYEKPLITNTFLWITSEKAKD